MARLIDADDLIERIEDVLSRREHRQVEVPSWLQKIIDELPTAYDVDKVVGELHEFSLNTIPYCNEMLREDLCDDSNDCDYCKLQHAIDIVRKGGVE